MLMLCIGHRTRLCTYIKVSAVAWQSDKLESTNFVKIEILAHPLEKGWLSVQDYANLLRTSLFCWFDRR